MSERANVISSVRHQLQADAALCVQAAQACTFAHTHGYYGENLYASTTSPANWSAVISAWANEAPS